MNKLERDDMFNIQCREDKYDPNNSYSNFNSNSSQLKRDLKEITGESFDVDQYDMVCH